VLDATEEVADGVWVEQSVFDGSTGTGVFESFVRLNSNQTVVSGFNTSGRPLQNDEMASANFTRDLLLSAVPLQPRTVRPRPSTASSAPTSTRRPGGPTSRWT
jgi:hypothetical protein